MKNLLQIKLLKIKKSNEFIMPDIIRAQAIQQVNRCSNNMNETSMIEPAGFVDVDFTNFIVKRIAIYCDRDNEIIEDVDDKDIIKDYIIEIFREILACNILSNAKRFIMYDRKIEDKASDKIIFLIKQSC